MVHQPSAPQGFHDNDGNPLFFGVFQARDPGLGMLVQVIVLDLTEIPIIGVDQLAEHVRIAVIGKAHLADFSAGLFLCQPVGHAQGLDALPGFHVGEHMHQVIVDMIGLQAAKLLLEIFFHIAGLFQQIMGQLGGDIDSIPNAVAAQDFAQGRFAAGVHIGGIKIIHPALESGHDLLFRLVQIGLAALGGKAHAPVAQDGEGSAGTIVAVLHKELPFCTIVSRMNF